ncbi:MAG: hypothetical protein AB1Z98_35085 [Nannocystaceae bacterium]
MHPSPSIRIALTLGLGLGLAACATGTEDELVLDDRAGSYPAPPAEQTAEAFGMLRVANELSFEQLDDDVPLDVRAANSIFGLRAGADELIGTADDQYVSDIAELDSLYWMGPAMLWRVLEYAVLEGFVPATVPAASCEPELSDAIDQCLRFVELAAAPAFGDGFGVAPFKDDIVGSCLEASDPTYPSADFFVDGGVVGFDDPVLGYQRLLCDGASPAPVCELGVAGIGTRSMPECDELFGSAPVLSDTATDPVDAAAWAATIAALEAACFGDCGYTLRVLEYAPGMAPTLLGDVMAEVTTSSSLGYTWPWITLETSSTLPSVAAGAQALLTDVIDDLGLTGEPFDVGAANEEVPCPNCHIFHDSYALMFRGAGLVVVLDVDTFWDS